MNEETGNPDDLLDKKEVAAERLPRVVKLGLCDERRAA